MTNIGGGIRRVVPSQARPPPVVAPSPQVLPPCTLTWLLASKTCRSAYRPGFPPPALPTLNPN